MSFIKPLNYLNHYHRGYKDKIFSNEILKDFTDKLKQILEDKSRSEENLKNAISTDILVKLFNYETTADFNNIDLCIKRNDIVNVIFEFKSSKVQKLGDIKQSKALHETIWYFHKIDNNENIKNVVISNGFKWFFIDPKNYNKFEQLCKKYKNDQLNIDKTDQLYRKIGEKINNDGIDFDYTEIDLTTNTKDEPYKLLYKFLYKDFLLRDFTYKDSNELNSKFYTELLYILGLKESRQKGKLVIIENGITGSLSYLIKNCLDNATELESILNILTIWLNRIIFLKLFDSQLFTFTKSSFFNSSMIKSWGELNELFFNILGKPIPQRMQSNKFKDIPYLNSSLFERTIYESTCGNISNLNNDCKIQIKSNSVLQKNKNYPKQIPLLKYMLDFFDCYNFTQINSDTREIISTSVLGLIFEKLNGYKDGSYFTPSVITEYMAKDCITQLVIDKFNEKYNLQCTSLDDLKEYLSKYSYIKKSKNEFNRIFNSIRIIDIAVGSGHFLVSCLNYLVYLKYELGLLNSSVLKGCRLAILNDNLTILRSNGIDTFIYKRNDKTDLEIQKHIFETKASIIQNCLYGSDINPKSVEICCLRLWIELLKNAYYKTTDLKNSEMETLPNIDINIRCGNSILNVAHPKIDETFINRIEFQMSYFDFNGYVNLIKKYTNSPSYSEKPKLKKMMRDQRADLITYMKSKNDNIEYMIDFPELLDQQYKFLGFDLVIGNPPYIKEYENRKAFDGLRDSPYYEGKMDIWSFFTCIGIDILKPNGYLSFIAPNNWTTNYGAEIMRNKILADTQIQKIIDFNDYMVFSDASIQTMIFKLKKIKNNSFTVNLDEKIKNYDLHYFKYKSKSSKLLLEEDRFENIKFSNFCNYKHYSQVLNFNNKIIDSILTLIDDDSYYKFSKHEIGQGIVFPQDFLNKDNANKLNEENQCNTFKPKQGIFVLTKNDIASLNLNVKEQCLIKPYYTSNEINNYYVNENCLYLIYTDSKFKDAKLMSDYPNLKNHLDKYSSVITSCNKPYGLHRSRNENLFKNRKIIVKRKCSYRPVFSYSDSDTFVSQTFNIIKTSECDLVFLTGLLNSKLIAFWLKFKGKMQGNNYQVDAGPLMNIPLCINKNITIENDIKTLTEEVIVKKTMKVEILKRIDNLVYQLYGLSCDQQKVIEDNIPDL